MQQEGQQFRYTAQRAPYLSAIAPFLVITLLEGSMIALFIILLVQNPSLKLILLLVLIGLQFVLIVRILLSALWTSHHLTASHLNLHYGLGRVSIPRTEIAEAHAVHERMAGLQIMRAQLDTQRQCITMAFSEHGQVLLTLKHPLPLRLNRQRGNVRSILFNLDQRDEFLAALSASLHSAETDGQSRHDTDNTTNTLVLHADKAQITAPLIGPSSSWAIRTEHLTRRYRDKTVVDDLNLAIVSGEIYGFLGLNGAGKTTTLKMLTGLLKPDQGRALLNGHDVWTTPVQTKHSYGYMPDRAILYEQLSGREFLQFLAQMRSIPEKRADERITTLLAMLDLTSSGDALCSTYSFGMKRKLALAGALLHQPPILLLDEPFNGLDPRSMHHMKDLYIQLAATGTTILLSTHDLATAEAICHRIGILHHGRLIAEDNTQTLRQAVAASNLEEVFLAMTTEPQEVLS